ncbi:MAG: gluconate 2-dehydrogenase subunit 3 family protein [Saprospiraceae bacterium]|nr:gluconate 2-dehydrogenase subunit 3 family protein [Saprospiraceae bacterium]MCF8250476.1 gluconate 2-dehydrogenase subunit 3 family protein [Saprospiraceae bacterium]MCF8281981.1 gluconate 2-dehydrogenase subunit 3 family protein [Bacteroidales bacterium]MCF8312378.1 gluconate 2-dehydrogenase subunit 3 family protein [Saprospiraceae bacterium]MCF8440625.1 gluconate 2-dehydrogenase subunit 3 family protein [Saprospiraceae bacterium]
MKRRQALKHLVIISSGAAILPSCGAEPSGPVYENISLTNKQRRLFEDFTNALLPKEKTSIITPETTPDFILTVLNNCHSPADVQQFELGLTALQALVNKKYKADFGALGTDQQAEILKQLSGENGVSEPLKFFYDTARKMTVEHFTSSEFFMKNITGWEFAPGYFKGCVATG